MRQLLLCLLILFGSKALLAQENTIAADSIAPSGIEEYIEDQKRRLNVKFEVNNDVSAFLVEDDGTQLTLKPNLDLRYGFVFSYKFLSVRLGVRPRTSSEDKKNKGESDTYRLKLQLLFDNWSHLIQYNYDRGYFVDNTLAYFPDAGSVKVQLPYLTSNIVFGSSAYKFNKNYSIRSIQAQTEIQVKSAGSLVLGGSYNLYKLVGTDRVLLPNEELELRNPSREYYGVSLAATAGYYYTFVLKRNWFINAFGVGSTGIDLYQTKTRIDDKESTNHNNDLIVAIDYGTGGGYNGEKFFFGAELKNRRTNEKFGSEKTQIRPLSNTFSVYFGYRFKAPKQVSKPVDLIEEKVPILKQTEKNKLP